MTINLKATITGQKELSEFLTEVEKKALPIANRRATNRSLVRLKTRGLKEVSREANIPQKPLKTRVKMRRAARKKTFGEIFFGLNEVDAFQLGAKQRKHGVKAGKHQFDKAFIARMPNTRFGVYKRSTKARLPISRQNVELGVDSEQIIENILDKEIPDFYEKTFNQDMIYLLEKASK